MQQIFVCILIFLTPLCFTGCRSQKATYRVGMDPYFYPLVIHKRTAMLSGFSLELLEEIGRIENVHFVPVPMSWNNLLYGLNKNTYQAALSVLQPYIFNEKKYAFSEAYFSIGLLLLVQQNSKVFSLEDLTNKEIVIPRSPDLLHILEEYPDVFRTFYRSPEDAFNLLIQGKTTGAIIENYIASGFLREPYPGKVTALPPLITNKGMYLLTTSGKNEKIIKLFNSGLQKLKKEGKYDDLIKKWNLDFIQ